MHSSWFLVWGAASVYGVEASFIVEGGTNNQTPNYKGWLAPERRWAEIKPANRERGRKRNKKEKDPEKEKRKKESKKPSTRT